MKQRLHQSVRRRGTRLTGFLSWSLLLFGFSPAGGCRQSSDRPADSTVLIAPPSGAKPLTEEQRDAYNRSLDTIYGEQADPIMPRPTG